MRVLKERLKSEYINKIIEQVLQEYEISISYLYTVTTDNGSNFDTSGELLQCDQILENTNTEGDSIYFNILLEVNESVLMDEEKIDLNEVNTMFLTENEVILNINEDEYWNASSVVVTRFNKR